MSRTHRKLRVILLTLGIVAIGALFLWFEVVRYELTPKNFGVVEPGQIYRSGQLTERMLRHMTDEHGIKTIIAMNGDDEESVMEARVAEELGIDRFEYSLVGDGTGKPAAFGEILGIMSDERRQPVLVHCAAGAHRTTTAVILYRHLVQGVAIADAYRESFDYKHEPEEWDLLAFLAENVKKIKRAYERDAAAKQ